MKRLHGTIVLCLCAVTLHGQSPKELLNRGVAQFEQGMFAASAATFDRLARAVPEQAPHLWQRGIALYYAGRYSDCRRQFESHRTVNPDDVENAAWHFLCVARERNAESARAALLPVGPDPRTPMREIYQMFAGAATPDDVIRAGAGDESGQFYAHLYVALYAEALGRRGDVRKHIAVAAADRYERAGGYMHMVARVHARALGLER